MSDSGPNSGAGEMVNKSILNPIKDELGKMVEVGVQSVIGSNTPQDPQEEAKKKAEDQRKIQNIKNFFAQMQANEQRLRQQKAEAEQLKAQETQVDAQKDQEKVVQEQKKQTVQNQSIVEKQRATELRPGKGVGG